MKEEISVLIPTYNRRNQLKEVLTILNNQTCSEFRIVISDNNSDYNVADLIAEFPKNFQNRIRLYKRKFNIGIDYNILGLFQLCETRYAWTLSDDEIVYDSAIETIYKTIGLVGKFGCINFSLYNNIPVDGNSYKKITSITEFIDCYYNPVLRRGKYFSDLIFLSNKIFDLTLAGPYIEFAYRFAYTGVSTVVIFSKMLEKGVPFVNVRDRVVDYNEASERTWTLDTLLTRIRTIYDVPYELDRKARKKLLNCLTYSTSILYKIYFVDRMVKNYKSILGLLYFDLYKNILSPAQRIAMKMCSIITRSRVGYELLSIFFRVHFGLKEIAYKIARKYYRKYIKERVTH